MSVTATVEQAQFDRTSALEDAWVSILEAMHGRRPSDPAELARDAATCGLSLEQVAEFAKRIERAKELEAALATRDQLRDEIERTGERFIAARQKLKEETTRLEGELRAARSAHLVAQDRLRHTDDAAVEIERLRRNHPALFSGAVPEFLRGLVE